MPNGKRHMILHLADQGQDFLWWEVKDGEVIDCGPFLAWLWKGARLIDDHIVVGNRPFIERAANGDYAVLHYPVERIEYLDEEPAACAPAVATGTGAAVTGCGG